jgi:hypothetical protein
VQVSLADQLNKQLYLSLHIMLLLLPSSCHMLLLLLTMMMVMPPHLQQLVVYQHCRVSQRWSPKIPQRAQQQLLALHQITAVSPALLLSTTELLI